MRDIYGVKISNPRFQWPRYLLRDAVTKRFLSENESDRIYATYLLAGIFVATLLTLIIKYAFDLI